jgi:hypothetical protein
MIQRNEQQAVIEQVIVMGDLARLNAEQRNIYYKSVCESLGLNPLTRPFEYITLNGKLTLYARKDCTDQLRKIHSVSVRIAERAVMDDLMVVTAEATDRAGRTDSSIGAVSIAGLRGEAKANALMKAETKARRRVTLALCGLGMLDESELDGIPNPRLGEPAAPRAADKLLAAAPAPVAAPTLVAVAPVAADPAPVSATPTAAPVVSDGDSSFEVVDIQTIEEHKGKAGLVWKVTTMAGASFACADPLLISDLADARAEERPLRIEWQQRGRSKVILSAEAVSE